MKVYLGAIGIFIAFIIVAITFIYNIIYWKYYSLQF